MRKQLLTVVFAMLAGISVSNAQATMPLPQTSSGATLTRIDTAQAVHELFIARRTGGVLLTGFGILFTGLGISSFFTTPPNSSGDVLVASSFTVGTGLIPATIGIGKIRRYSPAKEQQVLLAYANGGKLERKYTRRLRGNFRPVSGSTQWPIGVVDTTLHSTPASAKINIPFAGVSTSGYTLTDSLDAVAALFQNKRLVGQLPILALLPAARLLSGSSEADRQYNVYTGQYEENKPSAGAVVAGLGLAIGGVTYMFIHNAPYSNAKYAELVTASQTGAPIPAKWRAQLKPKHFGQGRELRNRMLRREARKNRNK